MKKTLSQKIARIFEVIGFILMIPGSIGTLLILYLCLINPLFLAALIVPVSGFILLIGYFKHSRGTINEKRIFPLWIGTFLYNLMFLLPTAVYFYNQYTAEIVSYYAPNNPDLSFTLSLGFLTVWWMSSILLSIIAMRSEINESYNI